MVKGVKILGIGLYEIQSFSNPNRSYVVDRVERSCTCECFKARGWCKHLAYVFENEVDLRRWEAIWKADKEFKEQQQRKLLERLRGFKPLDEQSRRFFRLAGWDYCEDLSALVQALVEG
jgi:hypothetical protein